MMPGAALLIARGAPNTGGVGSVVLTMSIPTGTVRAFQATTRTRAKGQDTTDTISVAVSSSDVVRRGSTTS